MSDGMKMLPLALAAGGLVCGAAALIVTLGARGAASEPARSDELLQRHEALESRLETQASALVRLEKRLEQVARSARAPRVSAGAPPSTDTAALDERIAALEARVAENAESSDAEPPKEALARAISKIVARRKGDDTAKVEELQRIAVDPAATSEVRLHALGRLRGVPGGRTREVAIAMMELVRTSESAEVRADVIRNLHRVEHPEIKQGLLDALRDDPDRRVREEAAETLDRYLDDEAVRSALDFAARNDESVDVRRQALESLGREER